MNSVTTPPVIRAARLKAFSGDDLENLCDATEAAIRDGIGFNWIVPPDRQTLESYWRGVLLVPERLLIGGWLDNTLLGAAQLVKPSRSKETTSFQVTLESHFVAPTARGHGLARRILEAAEREAMSQGFSLIRLSVRETQEAALHLYKEAGYVRWGTLPFYEILSGQMTAGHFFYKPLEAPTQIA